ncbi:hypothetical protein [Flavobacterium saliperosum]|uniref:YhhN-like protein n=2 Tax=Flavobacterium saliperosum TaxID=329186 RepID=A0A1G4VDV7_9FLAO|nr:hypothetical protein [Flavobacterium saliperosum]SCX05217.1 hypothetical protein SAMN02927925_00773 [Flavobacterium saliperosum]
MKHKDIPKLLIILYFINLFLYSFFSFINKEEITEIFWFVRIPILFILYFISSKKRKIVYLSGLLLYQLASVFYYVGTADAFLYATVSSMLFKFCLVLLILDLVSKSNYKAICVAFIPFFVIYLYIIEFVVNSLGDSYYIWIVNALFTSFIGGVAIINYVNDPKERNYWLLISSILFIVQIGAFFINKFYIKNEGIYQMVILAYGISHYTFYKFMILKEQEKE